MSYDDVCTKDNLELSYKAAVEGTVGIISTFILAALRNRQFLSLAELNEAIWGRLEAFNHKPFQKREGSRKSNQLSELQPVFPAFDAAGKTRRAQ